MNLLPLNPDTPQGQSTRQRHAPRVWSILGACFLAPRICPLVADLQSG